MTPLFALLLSCAGPEAPGDALVPLAAPRLARRASLELRGVLPSVEELDAVEDDPTALDGLIDGWLDDPLLEERLVMLLGDRWWTRLDVFEIPFQDYDLRPEQEVPFERAVGEEPLRLMARVAVEDRPWSEIVTAEHTMATDLLASIWPLDYPEGATGWQEATYTDGRPMVGVLSTNGLWWRYTTNQSNMNRGRAAALARLLLCEDFLARPVSFSATEADLTDLEHAVHHEPVCLACHAAVDPLAANLFGFWWVTQYSVTEETRYHPERESLAQDMLDVEPAWFGTPVSGLSDLGWAVASDPRFYRCAVQTFAEGLWRRDATPDDDQTIEALRQGFLADGALVRPLLAAILATPEFQAGAVAGDADDAVAERERTARLLSPWQLATTVEDLTGFVWTIDGTPRLDIDVAGYRVLAGGVDGETTYRLATEPGLTWSLATQRLAEGAARAWVEAGAVPTDAAPGDAAFREALSALHWRLYAERADDLWLGAIGGLWEQVAAEDGAEEAWVAVLSAMLRDPRFVTE